MARDNHLEELEDAALDAMNDMYETVQNTYPSDSTIQAVLMMSYKNLTPEQQVQIVEQVGADWFLKLSAKIERRLRRLTSVD